MTKPEKVEVGQRWDSPFSPKGSTNRVIDRVEGSRVYFDVGSWTTVGELLGDEKGYVYLGGPPATPGAVMEARGDGTFSNALTSQPITAENMKRAMDAIEALKNKTVFMPKPDFRYGVDYGWTTLRSIYGVEPGTSPKTAPSVSTPVLPRCKWNEPKQEYPGALVYCTGCENPVAHPASPFCESHISQAMDERDHKKREAHKESPFQQSHCGRNGMLGVWSLREES